MVSASGQVDSNGHFGAFVSGLKIPFPGTETAPSRERFECAATTGKAFFDFGLVIPEGKLARFVSATDSEVSVAIGMLPTQAAL